MALDVVLSISSYRIRLSINVRKMKTIILLCIITVFSWVGWWLGSYIGVMTAYFVSFFFSLLGVYVGVRINRSFLG